MINDLLQEFQQTRKKSIEICNPLEIEDYVLQPAEFVSPAKWHLGHTSWFFETFFLPHKYDYKVFHPDFNFVFNSYYESLGKKVLRHKRSDLSRPTVKEILEYRTYVDQHMFSYLENKLLSIKETEILEIGIHHEKQHQELLYTAWELSHFNLFIKKISV